MSCSDNPNWEAYIRKMDERAVENRRKKREEIIAKIRKSLDK